MTLIRPSLDYTDKDFDALSARLFNLIPTAFPEWTDTQVANFGNLLVEMFAFVGDVLTYYQDNQALESRWSTAQLRRSLLSMAKLIGYKAKGASSATANLTFQLATIPTAAVVIEAGDSFTTDGFSNITFYAVSRTVIPTGANPPVAFIDVENAEVFIESFASVALASQKFVLKEAPYVDGSLTVLADNGTFTVVEDFLNSGAVDRHVVLSIDANSRATIVFGDGINGRIPIGTILCSYKVGGGVAGNVAAGKITQSGKSYTDVNGTPVTVKVINAAAASGGSDIETVEAMREAAPATLRALTRTVCREDYEINALRVPGVSRALMVTSNEQPTILENRGTLYIIPEGGGVATQALCNRVLTTITKDYPKTITFLPTVRPAKLLSVAVTTRVHLRPTASAAVVGSAIRTAVTKFFALNADDGSRNANIDFGWYLDGAIAWSDVFNVVRDTAGVRKVDDGLGNLTLNGQADDLELAPDQFPVLQSVTVINAATGLVI